jgi:anti-anti-sigma factor
MEEAVDDNPFVVTVDGGCPVVVRADGELDLAGAPRLLSVLATLDGDVELHCSGLEFIDAAGLSAFLRAHETWAARGHKLVVVDPSPAMLRILRIVELDTVLHLRRDGAPLERDTVTG